jgi:hypothetical protein
MDRRLADFSLKVTAGALTTVGLVAVLVGYLGVRDHSDLVLQLPYLVSGGLGGLALIGLGALALIQYQMRVQAATLAAVTDQLEDWKERAAVELKTELRRFLDSAEIEIEVATPL